MTNADTVVGVEDEVEGLARRAIDGDRRAARTLVDLIAQDHAVHRDGVLTTLAHLDHPVMWQRVLAYVAGRGWEGRAPAPPAAVLHDLQRLFIEPFGQPLTRRREAVAAALHAAPAAERALAATLAGRQQNRAATDRLIALLNDPAPEVRAAAAHALQAMPDPRAIEPLLVNMNAWDVAIRRSAADALCSIGLPALPALLHRLIDGPTSPVFRNAAAHALPHLAVGANAPDVGLLEDALRGPAAGSTVPVAAHRLLVWCADQATARDAGGTQALR